MFHGEVAAVTHDDMVAWWHSGQLLVAAVKHDDTEVAAVPHDATEVAAVTHDDRPGDKVADNLLRFKSPEEFDRTEPWAARANEPAWGWARTVGL